MTITTAQWKLRYRVGPVLGQGGFKRVHRAVEVASGELVAFAQLFDVDLAAFDREIALAQRVSREHVAGVRDVHVDRVSGEAFIVFDLCEGPTLAELVQSGALPLDRAAPLMVAFARGLEAVHAAHVLHRDVKLENVVVSARGTKLGLSILDFGLAARADDENTRAGVVTVAGTLGYMARELVRGEPVDARTDAYALGVCFYRMLTGRFPFEPRGSAFQQLEAVARMGTHDLSALPRLPDAVRGLIARLLEHEIERRPYLPEVVRVLVEAFGEVQAEVAGGRPASRGPSPVWAMEWSVPIAGATPSTVLPAPCGFAPLIAWSAARPTVVYALTKEGATRWRAEVDLEVRAGVRADLDRDGVRELYLVGDDKLISLDARGRRRFERPLVSPPGRGTPSVLVVPGTSRSRLVIDGVVYDGEGAPTIRLPHVSEGDGARLIDATGGRGLAYNGLAHQAFRGEAETAAAILHAPGAQEFLVAHLEAARGAPRAVLSVYGPGGARRHRFAVADALVATGDAAQVLALVDRRAPLFGPAQAPLAVLDARGEAVVIVPFVGAPRPMPSVIAAFSLSRGAELWREPWAAGAVVLGDADGDGAPEVIAGDGEALVAWSHWTGERRAEQPARGLPAAVGDPFGAGRTFLFTTAADSVDVLRGPECMPGRMQWVGPRGDQWRSGALRADGQPFGMV